MSNQQTVRQYLDAPYEDNCNNFYDWFCKDSDLPNKQIALDKKVRRLMASTKLNMDTMYVWYKNNCPMSGSNYDDIRFSDHATGDVIFTIVPASGHKSTKGRAEVWGKVNDFEEPLVQGTWKDVLTFFGVA